MSENSDIPRSDQLKAAIEKAVAKADKAAEQWVKEADKNIEQRVRQILDARLLEIVAKLMGFDHRWNEWEVDHCNGRGGESAVGQWIRKRAAKEIEAWLEKQAGSLPELPKTAIKSMHKDYLERLYRELQDELDERAQSEAKRLLESVTVAGVTIKER